MSKTILILGAAGEIARMLTANLLEKSDWNLVLYGRNLSSRLNLPKTERIRIVEGNFEEEEKMTKSMVGSDFVYLNAMENRDHIKHIIASMNQAGVQRLIAASMAGIENEVPDPLASWTKANLPQSYIQGEIDSANEVKASNLDYTLLRLTWLYNNPDRLDYELVPSGQPFTAAEVSRQAVVAAILEVLNREDNYFIRTSYGVGQPDSNYGKPSFY